MEVTISLTGNGIKEALKESEMIQYWRISRLVRLKISTEMEVRGKSSLKAGLCPRMGE